MMIRNYPLCVAVSCDAAALPAQIEEAIDSSVDIGEDDVEAYFGGSVDCQAVATPSRPDPADLSHFLAIWMSIYEGSCAQATVPMAVMQCENNAEIILHAASE